MNQHPERDGLLKKLPVDRKKITDAISPVHRDITASRLIPASDHDWVYTIAYNAILRDGRVLGL